MLSKSNVEKLKKNGIYKTKNEPKTSGEFGVNPYHCKNWVFRVIERDGEFIMVDTYWSSVNNLTFTLTDENIDNFELVFEEDKVKRVKSEEAALYEKSYLIAIDSGGWSYPKYFVDEDASPSNELEKIAIETKINKLEREIKILKEELKNY